MIEALTSSLSCVARTSSRTLRLTALTGNLVFCVYAGATVCDSFVQLSHERTAVMHILRLTADINNEDHRRRSDPAAAVNALERYRANWLYSLNCLAPFEITKGGSLHRLTADELLFNTYRPWRKEQPPWKLPWGLMGVAQYDQLPRPVLEVTLERQFEQYGRYLDPKRWPDMSLEEWRELPVPIQKAAAYRMIWEWAGRRSPERHGLSQAEASRILASIALVESLLDLDKIRNFNEITRKEDRGYMQISDMARHELRRVPEFRHYKAKDYYKPWVSIQAGSYFFDWMLERAADDVYRAIGMYNAGPHGDKDRARRYRQLVTERYLDTFLKKDGYSPTRFLVIGRAREEFFKDVEGDLLFEKAVTQNIPDDVLLFLHGFRTG